MRKGKVTNYADICHNTCGRSLSMNVPRSAMPTVTECSRQIVRVNTCTAPGLSGPIRSAALAWVSLTDNSKHIPCTALNNSLIFRFNDELILPGTRDRMPGNYGSSRSFGRHDGKLPKRVQTSPDVHHIRFSLFEKYILILEHDSIPAAHTYSLQWACNLRLHFRGQRHSRIFRRKSVSRRDPSSNLHRAIFSTLAGS